MRTWEEGPLLEAGLEVAPGALRGLPEKRMLEGDWEAEQTPAQLQRTLACTQQPQQKGFPFHALAGRFGLGLEMGRLRWVGVFDQAGLGLRPKDKKLLFSALGTGESVQLPAKGGSISPFSHPQTLKLFFLDCVLPGTRRRWKSRLD